MSDTHLDLKGLKCPLPASKLRKALGKLSAGDTIHVACTDPLAAIDIPNLLRETGDALVSQARDADLLSFTIRKS